MLAATRRAGLAMDSTGWATAVVGTVMGLVVTGGRRSGTVAGRLTEAEAVASGCTAVVVTAAAAVVVVVVADGRTAATAGTGSDEAWC